MAYIEDSKGKILKLGEEILVMAREINHQIRPQVLNAQLDGNEEKAHILNIRAQILVQSINEKSAEIEARAAILKAMGIR
jgi:hypothetical protein